VAQDHAQALHWLQLAAAQGNADAERHIGLMYDKGRGVAQDRNEAHKWFAMAAAQGDTKGQYDVGVDFDEGDGVDSDPAEAARWYKLAADKGYAEAQNNLGGLYATGRGVAQDDAEALRPTSWPRRRALVCRSEPRPVTNQAGRGVPQDFAEALRRYQRPPPRASPPATTIFGALYENARACRRPREGHGPLQAGGRPRRARGARRMGQLYDYGWACEGPGQALVWYRKAADAGDVSAQSRLGDFYDTGIGVAVDHHQPMSGTSAPPSAAMR